MTSSKRKKREEQDFQYDVCLSFAGEDRAYVKEVARELNSKGVRVFYDEYERAELWGKDLYTHLDDIYQNSAKYCVLFASKNYAKKLWTSHERQSAQARAFKEHKEYILPARFDNTVIPGLRDTVGYINLRKTSPAELATLILKKIGKPERTFFLPPQPDLLFKRLGAKRKTEKDAIFVQAHGFLSAMKRMSPDERFVVAKIFEHSCPAELPDIVHINLDLLRRYTGFPPSKIKRILGSIRSLGFYSSIRDDYEDGDGYLGKSLTVVLEWHYLGVDLEPEDSSNATFVAHEMIAGVIEHYCDEHADETLQRLDFSRLSSATIVEHKH